MILASSSPRRRELLGRLGLPFQVVAPDVDETPMANEPPADYVRRVARDKARAVFRDYPDELVIAADTTVTVDNRIIGKPDDADMARAMLQELSGRSHEVISGVAIVAPKLETTFHESTEVTMRAISPLEIAAYLACDEWRGKAGAYAVQGVASCFVERVSGSITNVVGMPLSQVCQILWNQTKLEPGYDRVETDSL